MKPTEPGWPAAGWLRTSADTEVEASPEAVWAVLADATTWTTWYKAMRKFDVSGNAVFGSGAAIDGKDSLFDFEARINEWSPGQAIGMTFTASSFSWLFSRYAERITIEPLGAGNRCVVKHEGRLAPSPFGWLLAGYTLAHALGGMWFDYRSSTKHLALTAEDEPR